MSANKNLGILISLTSLIWGAQLLLKEPLNYLKKNISQTDVSIAVIDNNNQRNILDGKSVTIKTYFTNVTSATSPENADSWPKLALFINNGDNYDGPYDYAPCYPADSPPEGCGASPSFNNRLIEKFDVSGINFVKTTTVDANKAFYPIGGNVYATKISYVFYNDYWNPGTNADRNLSINKIEILDNVGTLVKTYTPQDNSYYGGYGQYQGQNTSFYFDMGLVNDSNESTEEQNSFAKAFDKQSLVTIVENKSKENNAWSLGQEGSFNVVSLELASLLGIVNGCPKGAITEGDCDINMLDLLLLLSQIVDDKPYNVKYDLVPTVPDGKINMLDLLFILNIVVG